MIQDQPTVTYMREKILQLDVEKPLPTCLSYWRFVRFPPKNSICPQQQSHLAPAVECRDCVTIQSKKTYTHMSLSPSIIVLL